MSPGMRLASLPRSRTGAAGSSLIELLICLGIMGIITTGMYAFFVATNQAYGEQAVVSRMVWTTNDALRRIAQDIRQAGTPFAFGPAGASLLPAMVSASNAGGGSITIRVVLDDPARRTELTSDQLQTNPTFQVLSTTGYNVNDVAFLTDGVQCTRFVVTGVTGGGRPPASSMLPPMTPTRAAVPELPILPRRAWCTASSSTSKPPTALTPRTHELPG